MSKIYVPPIKCQGIKTKLVDWVRDMLVWDREGRWIEPFTGSGVVGFNIMPQRAIFSDSNPHTIRFYNAIQHEHITPAITQQFLEEEGEKLARRGEDYYYEVRERFNAAGRPLDFLFLNRACFNGVIRFNRKGEFNVPFGHKPQRFARAYITKIVNQVRFVADCLAAYDWRFVHQDFRAALVNVAEADYVYCDPPYIGRHTDYYNSWDEACEVQLFETLRLCPAPFMLSTWHSNQHRQNPYIESLWSAFHIVTRQHFYHIGAREQNRKPMLEALVLNYRPPHIPARQNKGSFQLQLFEPRSGYQAEPHSRPRTTG